MTAPLRPNAAPTYGRKNWIFVPTVAATTLIPTAIEVNAAGSLDFTNIVFADGTDKPTQTTNRVTAVRRMGDTVVPEQQGVTTIAGGNLTYQIDPQAATGSNGKKAFEKFVAGTTGFLVERLSKLNSTTPAVGDFVNVYPISFGPTQVGEAGDGETAEGAGVCSYFVTALPVYSVALT